MHIHVPDVASIIVILPTKHRTGSCDSKEVRKQLPIHHLQMKTFYSQILFSVMYCDRTVIEEEKESFAQSYSIATHRLFTDKELETQNTCYTAQLIYIHSRGERYISPPIKGTTTWESRTSLVSACVPVCTH